MKKILNTIPSVLLIVIIALSGFIIGVLTIVFGMEKQLLSQEIISQELLGQIKNLTIDKRAVFFLCLGKRLRVFLVLFLLAFSKVNVFVNFLFFFLNGFYMGSVMEVFAVRYGMQGIAAYLSLTLPQGIFYIIGFMLLGCWCLNLEKITISHKNMEKIKKAGDRVRFIISFLMIFIGIVFESYVNPEVFLFFI